MRIESFVGTAAAPIINLAATLRIHVFRDWPYLYDGDMDYERDYLQRYVNCPRAVIALAYDGERPVGATTGLPLSDAAEEMQRPFQRAGQAVDDYFYCGESVVLPEARGHRLGHLFFDLREAHAQTLGLTHSTFCAVDRPPDHPARPRAARTNDAFWTGRGYQRHPQWQCEYHWKDLGDDQETRKTLTFWSRRLSL